MQYQRDVIQPCQGGSFIIQVKDAALQAGFLGQPLYTVTIATRKHRFQSPFLGLFYYQAPRVAIGTVNHPVGFWHS